MPEFPQFKSYGYRLLYKCIFLNFRFLPGVILGFWLVEYYDNKFIDIKEKMVLLLAIWAIIISLANISFFSDNSANNALKASLLHFYSLSVVMVGIRYLPKDINNIFFLFWKNIGRSSYHIFLVQILYFGSVLHLLSKLGLQLNGHNWVTNIIINLSICFFMGIMFEKFLSRERSF